MKISWIEPGILAASGIPLDAKDMCSLHAQGIRAILTLTEQPLSAQREITASLLAQLDMVALHSPVRDQYPPSPEQAAQILEQIQAMRAQQRPLLVHCHAGIGRTGTILHLYYLAQGLSLTEARAQVRRTRIQSILLSAAQEDFLTSYSNPSTN